MKLFYTYIHKKASDNSVFYVGKGVGKRAWDCKRRNPKWRSIASKHGHTVEVCAEWKTQEEAFEHEKFLIFCFKDMGLNLANLTDGGDGPTGYKYTEEQKQKRKHLRIGYKHSEETKKKIGDAQRGIPRGPMSEEVRRQMSISRTGRKGKPMSEEQKKKLSENNGSRRPEVREKISKSLMGKSPSKEARLKQSMKTKGVKKSEEHKEKIRQGRLAYFQRQREVTGRACTISEEHKAALRKGYNKHFGIEE